MTMQMINQPLYSRHAKEPTFGSAEGNPSLEQRLSVLEQQVNALSGALLVNGDSVTLKGKNVTVDAETGDLSLKAWGNLLYEGGSAEFTTPGITYTRPGTNNVPYATLQEQFTSGQPAFILFAPVQGGPVAVVHLKASTKEGGQLQLSSADLDRQHINIVGPRRKGFWA